MNKNMFNQNIKNYFIKAQVLLAINVLFFQILFSYVIDISSFLFNKLSKVSINNLSKEDLEVIKTNVKSVLINSPASDSLVRYFAFFYVDDYSKRVAFVSSDNLPLKDFTQTSDIDPFHNTLLEFHSNNICYVSNSINLPEGSVKTTLEENDEIQPTIFFIACPIFVSNTLIGYIGGITNKEDGSISIDINAVEQGAHSVGNLLKEL